MALTLKERELVAVGSSVAAGCEPCTHYHLREVRKAEASESEIHRAVADALRVRRNATEIMEGHGLGRREAAREAARRSSSAKTSRIEQLVSVGAAFAVNCTASLKAHLEASRRLGIAEDELREVARLAAFIKKMAASHVEKLIDATEDSGTERAKQASTSGSSCY